MGWIGQRLAGAKGAESLSHLGRYGMGPGGKELGDTGRVEPRLREAKRGTQACPSSADHHRVKLVVHHWVLRRNLEKENSLFNCTFNYARHTGCGDSERA